MSPEKWDLIRAKEPLMGIKPSFCQRMEHWNVYATNLQLLVTERDRAVCPSVQRVAGRSDARVVVLYMVAWPHELVSPGLPRLFHFMRHLRVPCGDARAP